MRWAAERDGVPKYVQLARIVREKITRRQYKAGDRIPTEAQLGVIYRMSRITVRQAIDGLVRDGLVERRQGRGTYVLPQKLKRDIAKVYSFTSDMLRLGLSPSSRVLALTVAEASAADAVSLQLPAGNRRVTCLKRIRMVNGLPILLETTLIPEHLCPDLVGKDFSKASLYRTLTAERRLMPHHAEETYEAIILSRRDAELLGSSSRGAQPAFAIRRLTYLENGLPIELTRSVGRGDRLVLAITMTSEQADVQRRVEGVVP